MKLALLVALLVGGCPAPAPQSFTIVAPPPAESTQPVATTTAPEPAAPDLPPSLQCAGDLGPSIKSPRSGVAPVQPVAGQMTEQAAQAKRLFDAEKWEEAVMALQNVASGQSGDDEGNKQLAEYHVAIALYRAKQSRPAYSVFQQIASNRGHIKHAETLLWLAKFVKDEPTLVDLRDLATYTASDVDRFHNENQVEIWAMLNYVLGRERLQEGAKDEARAMLGLVPPSHRFSSYAKKCIERT